MTIECQQTHRHAVNLPRNIYKPPVLKILYINFETSENHMLLKHMKVSCSETQLPKLKTATQNKHMLLFLCLKSKCLELPLNCSDNYGMLPDQQTVSHLCISFHA